MIGTVLRKLSRALSLYRENTAIFSRNTRLYLIGTFFIGMGFSGYMLLFNLYLKAIGFPESRIGHIITFNTLGTLAMAIPASMVIRRTSIRRILLAATLVEFIGSLARVAVINYSFILIAGVVTGAAAVFAQVAGAPFFMRNSTPRERPYIFSINSAAMMMAGFFGNLAAGFLPGFIERSGIAPYLAYRYTLMIFGGLVLAAFLPYAMIKESNVPRSAGESFRLRSDRSLVMRLFLPNMIIGLGAGLSIPFINLYFKNALGAQTQMIGLYYSISQLFLIAGTLAAPVIAEKFGKIKTVVQSQLLSIPFLIVMGITRTTSFAVLSFWIRAALMNMAQPLFTNYAMERVREEEQPFTSALLTMSWTAAWGLSASIGGILIERFSYTIPFLSTSLLYLIASLMMMAFFR